MLLKKGLFLKLISVLMILLVIAGCGSKTSTTDEQSNTQTSANDIHDSNKDPYALPFVEPGTVTFKYVVQENKSGLPSRSSGLPVIKEIERVTGINLEIESIPESQYATVISTRLAANTDLPDFLRMEGSHYEYGIQGVLLNLTPYIEKYDTYLEEYLKYEPESKKYFISPDGNYYGWYPVKSGTDLADPYGWIIRKDWLDNLGLKEPYTVDEWYNVMKAFKENDANLNGNPDDEIPWCNPGLECQTVWGHCWGLMMYNSEGWSVNENGKVELDWIKPEAKEMFTWLNKCFSEGLIDPEFLSMDHNARFSQNVVGGYTRFANTTESRAVLARQGGDPNAVYVGLPVPLGPDGQQGYMDSYGPADNGNGVAITNNCKDPDLAFRFCDWLWGSEEGNRYMWFGIENEHYIINEQGDLEYTDYILNNPDGYNPTTALQAIGGHEFFSGIRSIEGVWGEWAKMQLDTYTENTRNSALIMSKYIVPKFPALVSEKEEADELALYWNDIKTYYEEQAVGFIVGDKDLSEWDDYVNTIKSIGLDRVIEIKQKQYDRMMSQQ